MKLQCLFFGSVLTRLTNLMNPVKHFLDFGRIVSEKIDETNYKVIIFTDPQFGKYNKENGGDGTSWELDDHRMMLLCRDINKMNPKPAFIAITGDLAQGMPHDESQGQPGSLPLFRSAQASDFLDSLRNCDSEIPILISAGNRDLGNEKIYKEDFAAFGKQMMEPYFYFEFGGRYWITIETQCYQMTNGNAEDFRKEQDEWLKALLNSLPENVPKTVFQHKPLYIETIDEKAASEKEKSLDPENRMRLLEMYADANVDFVFSGHTHFNNVPEPYKGVNQIIMTSISHQNEWESKETGKFFGPDHPAYIIACVKASKLSWERIDE